MRYTLNLFVFLTILSCKPSEGTEEQAIAIASKMFEAFNQHEWEKMAGYYSDSALFLDPAFGKEYVTQSREAVIQKYKGFQEAFPDIHDEIVGMYASGDKVIVEFISTGKSSDGTSFTLPIISVLTINDDKIIKDATYYDVEIP